MSKENINVKSKIDPKAWRHRNLPRMKKISWNYQLNNLRKEKKENQLVQRFMASITPKKISSLKFLINHNKKRNRSKSYYLESLCSRI